jgi:hypothetical protein
MEKRVVFDFFGTTGSQTLIGVESHQSLHEIAGFVREFDPIFVPLNVSRQDIFENLLWCFCVKRGNPVEELVCDDA